MSYLRYTIILALSLFLFSTPVLSQTAAETAPATAETNPLAELPWEIGPTEGRIGDKAVIKVSEGYMFLGKAGTEKLLRLMENIPSGKQYIFAPIDFNWFSVFSFDDVGYVKDNETLDPQDLLDSITEGTKQANVEKRKRGWGTISILGWKFQPRYDKKTNHLEWALVAKDDASGDKIVNYNTRLLGRSGVMEVVLVADELALDASIASLNTALAGYNYVPGEQYAEYKEGDRVAQYGLAALVAGGVAAVASKKGFWAGIVAFLVAAKKFIAVAVIGFFVWLVSRFKSRKA